MPGPGELLAPDLIELLLEFEGSWFLSCLILPIPLGQRPVPDKSCGTGSPGKVDGLLRRGMESDLMGTNHGYFPLRYAKTRRTSLN
jgi:hypothetical protein